MAEKRYAIVRVDKYGNYLNSCPAGFEEINNDFVCSYKKSKTLNSLSTNCKNCRYGDTKEQLIRKVAQVLFQEKVKHFNRTFGKRFLSKYFIKNMKKEALKEATKIVEFLGVE